MRIVVVKNILFKQFARECGKRIGYWSAFVDYLDLIEYLMGGG